MNEVSAALQADVQYPWRKILQQAAQELDRQALLLAEAEDVLFTIATPKRPDGTYNMGREACEQLARRMLEKLCTPAVHPTPAEGTQPGACTLEPVAWLAHSDEFQMVSLFQEHAEAGAVENEAAVVPLYRQPRPPLTDAEREAIAWAANESDYWAGEGFNSSDDPRYVQIAATLRGLLERFK